MYSWSFQDHTTFIIFMAKVWMTSSKQFGWWRLLLYICLIFYSMWILHHFHKFTLLDEALLVCSVAVTTLIYLLRDISILCKISIFTLSDSFVVVQGKWKNKKSFCCEGTIWYRSCTPITFSILKEAPGAVKGSSSS